MMMTILMMMRAMVWLLLLQALVCTSVAGVDVDCVAGVDEERCGGVGGVDVGGVGDVGDDGHGKNMVL